MNKKFLNEYFFIFNPFSFESQKDFGFYKKLKKELEKIGIFSELHRTFQVGDVSNLIKKAVLDENHPKKIIIIGGDESLNEGIQKIASLGNSEISLGVVPTGKDNFLFKEFVSKDSNWKKAVWNLKNWNSKNIKISIASNRVFLKNLTFEKNFDYFTKEGSEEIKIRIDNHFNVFGFIRKIKITTFDEKFFVEIFSSQKKDLENKNSSTEKSQFFCKEIFCSIPESFLKFFDSSINSEMSKIQEFLIQKTSNSISFLA